MADSLEKATIKNKAKAIEMATEKGWPIKQEIEGTVIELQSISENGQPLYYITHNADAAESVSTNEVYSGGAAGLSLDGTNMIAGEWDADDVLTTHQEFTNTGASRITDMDGSNGTSNHATHVAGTILGGGVEAQSRGMAYNARLHAYDWNNDYSEMADAAAGGLLISNHSYGYISGWYWNGSNWEWYGDETISDEEDYHFGFYGDQAQLWDQIAYDAPYYLIVKSAGNDRGDGPSDGEYPQDGGDDGYDCIGWQGNSKNILTVGATQDVPGGYSGDPNDVEMTSFSSWGPSDDGRIKPDISANGHSLYSSSDGGDGSYTSMSGTSMSAPSTTGSSLLLQEHYNDLNGSYMRAATLKALAIHTADETGPHPGPDYMFGWGLLNTQTAAEVISNDEVSSLIQEESLSDGDSFTQDVAVPGTDPLVVTIVWTDPPGTPVSFQLDPTDPMLINDLDLTINDGSSKTSWYPYVLDGQNPANAATKEVNDVDNVEKIVVDSPSAGTYTIEVSHKGTLDGGSQNFSLVVSGIDDATKPSLTTASVGSITSSSAISGGEVTSNGGATVNTRGVSWSTSPDPTLNNFYTDDGTGEGSFVSNITGLEPNTQYYVRAYATNWVGTSYGDEETFVTNFGTLTWSGDTDSDITTASNWIELTSPTGDYNISIPSGTSNYPILQNGDNVTVNDIILEAGAYFSVNGSFTHNGALKIQSDASSTGSMIISGNLSSEWRCCG
ncbi:MAG: S8 family serine peptidase [Bacteroidales bacterium]|nr:S8 family serine peptidase [Bacteroidales bacterium]